ncbi:ubiquitin-related modifier 1 isoform X2 [Vanacampus margaritifer]
MAAPIAIHLEFGGGAELLFDGVKEHHVTLPSHAEPWDMKQLLVWIRHNLLRERPELFVQGDSVPLFIASPDHATELAHPVCVCRVSIITVDLPPSLLHLFKSLIRMLI